MSIIKFYIINLEDNKDRFISASSQLDQINIQFERIQAYDGRKLAINDFPLYNSKKAKSYMGRDLVGGEIGCYMSHLKCAKTFIDSSADYAVILEDDFKLNSNLEIIIPKIIHWLENYYTASWSLINIGNEKIKFHTPINKFTSTDSAKTLCNAFYFPMTTTGLIWNRDGAQEFIHQSKEIFAPVDNFFRYWLTRTGEGLAFDNPLVTTINASSTIDGNFSEKKRKSQNRTFLYGLIKQKRLLTDKIIASTNFIKKLFFSKINDE
jgi:glycosyl transferase family 25